MKKKNKSLMSLLKEDASSDIQNLITKVSGYEDFVSKLGDLAQDPKIQAFLKAGKRDGSDSDDKLNITRKPIPVKLLRPTQNEIDVQGSLHWPLTKIVSAQNILKKGPITIKAPAVVYNGKYIIDGHHRWSALYCMNSEGILDCFNITGPEMNPIDVLKIMQLAIVSDIGKVKTADVKGMNLLKASEASIKQYILKVTTPDCLKVFNTMIGAKVGKLDNESLATKVIIPNVLEMQTKNKPVSGAPSRNVMPQTDDAKDALKYLNKGIVNFNEPYNIQELRKHTKRVILEIYNKSKK